MIMCVLNIIIKQYWRFHLRHLLRSLIFACSSDRKTMAGLFSIHNSMELDPEVKMEAKPCEIMTAHVLLMYGWWFQPLWTFLISVSWDDCSQHMEKKHVPEHQANTVNHVVTPSGPSAFARSLWWRALLKRRDGQKNPSNPSLAERDPLGSPRIPVILGTRWLTMIDYGRGFHSHGGIPL